MNKITRWYNQNKRIFWIVLLIIVGSILLTQVLNNYYKNKRKSEGSSTNISTTPYNTNNYSIVTQEKINESISEQSSNLIKEFLDYCNNGKVEEAYNLLSTDCKEELYSTIDEFKTKYYNRIFTEKKSYDSTLWINTNASNTYRIQIMSDLLATGESEYMPIEDYYTIINENEEYKLNISRYIGKQVLGISKTQNDITINVISRKLYMDYEKYEISVQNNTGSKLIFNTKQNSNSIYLQDENELKYIAFLNEITDSELMILNGSNKDITIKFNRGYKPNTNIRNIVFEDISINGEIKTIIVSI